MHVTCKINNFTGHLYAFVGNLYMPESTKIYNIYNKYRRYAKCGTLCDI